MRIFVLRVAALLSMSSRSEGGRGRSDSAPASTAELETIVERLKAPARVTPQGVAMISLLLSDGAGPLYGQNPAHTDELRDTLQVAIAAVDHGPVLAR